MIRRCLAAISFFIAGGAAGSVAAQADYSITFMARETAPVTEGTPGHLFFCISTPVAQSVKEDCFGFYPDSPADVWNGPGTITNEFSRNAITNVSLSLSHPISAKARQDIYAVFPQYTGVNYRIHVNSCIDFAFLVARAAGLALPERSTLQTPTAALEGMRRLYWTGDWTSDDPARRFQLGIRETTVNWSETNAAGRTLSVTVPFAASAGTARIERANDASVLAHLGFQPQLINQIQARGPQPSYLVLRRIDDRISGDWSGLSVTKDNQANLQELRQPGSRPAAPFTFRR